MAKIGTAHVEIKPVLDEDALGAIVDRIADAVAEGVRRGMTASTSVDFQIQGDIPEPETLQKRIQQHIGRAI